MSDIVERIERATSLVPMTASDHEWSELLAAAMDARETILALRRAASVFLAKLDECQPHIDDAFLHRQMRCGEYDGPNYAEELASLRASLATEAE